MADKDPLGYDTFARTLWARIQDALKKDQSGQPLGDDPLVVGIFGEWGAGKSYLLSRMLKNAQGDSEQRAQWRSLDGGAGHELIVPVFFQPWKYEHEEHLLVPLLLHVLDDLKAHLALAQTWSEQARTASPEWVQKYTTHAVGAISTLASGAAWAMDTQVPGAARFGLAAVGWAAKAWADKQFAKLSWLKSFKHEEGGRHYYEIHRILRDLTRPTAKIIEEVTGQKINQPVRINFVIFIDDLDRCLPEKAVQTLELIKTVFNVESFAFVLALDDEVIERGIGHRYKEYKLQDKKPEMPITGFEYLEKIVHLPFRLPALTRQQAEKFVASIEVQIQAAPEANLSLEEKAQTDARLFFRYGRSNTGSLVAETTDAIAERPTLCLRLLLDSFDHYVPRKLIRAVELLYQVERVANEKGKGLNVFRHLQRKGTETLKKEINAMGPISPPSESFHVVLFGLLLLQLFQPEVFRLVRRKEATWGSLLGAFVGSEARWTSDQDVSEVALWQWATQFSRAQAAKFSNDTKPPHDWATSVAYLAAAENLSKGDQYTAQQVRMPLVQRLTEHMQVERHVFNPFKWAKALADLLGEQGVRNLNVRDYTQYLSEQAHVMGQAFAKATSEGRAQATIARAEVALPQAVIDNICDRMVSKDLGVQGELRKILEPYQGQMFDEASSKLLLQKLQASTDATMQILQGLVDVAPHIHPGRSGHDFWALVQDCGIEIPKAPSTITPDPVKASLYLDVQSMLGQDKRFDAEEKQGPNGQAFKPLYLLKERWNNNGVMQEPIPGFVCIPKGPYLVGDPEIDVNNPLTSYELTHNIFMGRTQVTVDQYSAFIADGGYGENEQDEKAKPYWDDQGWAWRHNTVDFQSNVPEDMDLQQSLSRRNDGLRAQPLDWADQKRIGSRALRGINWFEARAYACWLNEQLKQRGLFSDDLKGYEVHLPNEWQWEIAARADLNRWPWGNDDRSAGQRANIASSHINQVSVPGCFAPNGWGMLDMAGNVFEWLDSDESDTNASTVIPVRGGSFFGDIEAAAFSRRGGNPAVHGGYYMGLRMMLTCQIAPKKSHQTIDKPHLN